jgi:hypothetical protein
MLINLTSFYLRELENINIAIFCYQLDIYFYDVRLGNRFHDV